MFALIAAERCGSADHCHVPQRHDGRSGATRHDQQRIVPSTSPAQNLDGCIDKGGCGLMRDGTPIMVPILEAARCVLRQSAPSITPSVDPPRRHQPTATLARSPSVTIPAKQSPWRPRRRFSSIGLQ
jgi:hypothetical protein